MANIIINEFKRRYPESYPEKSDTWIWEKLKNPTNFKKAFPEFIDYTDKKILTNLRKYDPTIRIEEYLPAVSKERINYEKIGRELGIKVKPEATKEDVEMIKENITMIKEKIDWRVPEALKEKVGKIEITEPDRIKQGIINLERRKQIEIDEEIFKKLSERDRKIFWKRRKSRLSTITDIMDSFSGGFSGGFIGKDTTDYKPNSDIYKFYNVIGNIAGFSTSLYLLKQLAVVPIIVKSFKTMPFLAKLTPNMLKWVTRMATEGFAWAVKGISDRAIKQVREKRFDAPDLLKVGISNFGFGAVLGRLPIKKFIPRHLAATGVSGGWAVTSQLIKDGRIDKEDLLSILLTMGVVNLSQLSRMGTDKAIYNAIKKSRIQETLKKNLLIKLAERGNSPEAQKTIANFAMTGGRGKEVELVNPVQTVFMLRFGQLYSKVHNKYKKRFADLYMRRMKTYLDKKLPTHEAADKAFQEIENILLRYKDYRNSAMLTKNYITRFVYELKKGNPIKKSLENTKRIVKEFADFRKIAVDMKKFRKTDISMLNRLRGLIGKDKVTKKDLAKLFLREKTKITEKIFSKLSKEQIKNLKVEFKKTAPIVAKSTSIQEAEFLARQRLIRNTTKLAIERLDIKPETKKEAIKFVDNRINQVIKQFKDAKKLSKEGIRIKEISPLQMVTELERKKDISTAYKKLSEGLYKELKNFKTLTKDEKTGILSSSYLGTWLKGKGLLQEGRKITDIKEFKKFLPFFEKREINEINFVAKRLIGITKQEIPPQLMIHTEGRPLGVGVTSPITPADYTLSKYGLTFAADEMTDAMTAPMIASEMKSIFINKLMKEHKKLAKVNKINFKQSLKNLWEYMDKGDLVKDKLNKFELDKAKILRTETLEMFDKVNYIRRMAGQKEILRLNDYITHILKPTILNDIYTTGTIPVQLAKAMRYIPTRSLFLRTAQHRVDKLLDHLIIKDPYKSMRAMYSINLRYIYTAKAMQRLQPIKYIIQDSSKFDATVVRFMENQMRTLAKRPLKFEENINNTLENLFSGTLRTMGMKISKRPWRDTVNLVSALSHLAYLDMRPKFFIRNVGGQGASVWAMEGTAAFTWAIKHMFSKKGKRILKLIGEYKTRIPMEAAEKSFMNKLWRGAFLNVSASDNLNVRTAILASFYRGIKRFKNVRLAVEYAQREFRTTQWSYLRVNLPPILQSDTGRMAFMFSSWTLNNYFRRIPEIIRRAFKGYDVWGNKVGLTERLALFRFITWGAASQSLKLANVNFMWQLYQAQGLTTPPGFAPILRGAWYLNRTIIDFANGRDNLAYQNWYYTRQYFKGLIPFYYTGKDIKDVATGKKPYKSLFFYQYKFEKKPKTIEQIQQRKIKKELDSMKKTKSLIKLQQKRLIKELKGLR